MYEEAIDVKLDLDIVTLTTIFKVRDVFFILIQHYFASNNSHCQSYI